MARFLKTILWLAILAVIAYIIFGRGDKNADMPVDETVSEEETTSPAGDRAEPGTGLEAGASVEVNADASMEGDSMESESDTGDKMMEEDSMSQ